MSNKLPIRGSVEGIIGQEVIIEFPKQLQGDSSVRRDDVVVGFLEHGVEVVQGQVFRQQLVSQFVDFDQSIQFLKKTPVVRIS